MDHYLIPQLVKPPQMRSTVVFSTSDGRVLPVMDILRAIWMKCASTASPFPQAK